MWVLVIVWVVSGNGMAATSHQINIGSEEVQCQRQASNIRAKPPKWGFVETICVWTEVTR